MDVRGWPLDKIMSLPDHCFGRRFPVSVSCFALAGGGNFNISPTALPEWSVLWELRIDSRLRQGAAAGVGVHCLLSLMDFAPTSIADMENSEKLLPNYGSWNATHWALNGYIHLINLKYPIHTNGRRLGGYLLNDGAQTDYIQVSCVFSSLPTEVPDWLLSR